MGELVGPGHRNSGEEGRVGRPSCDELVRVGNEGELPSGLAAACSS